MGLILKGSNIAKGEMFSGNLKDFPSEIHALFGGKCYTMTPDSILPLKGWPALKGKKSFSKTPFFSGSNVVFHITGITAPEKISCLFGRC